MKKLRRRRRRHHGGKGLLSSLLDAGLVALAGIAAAKLADTLARESRRPVPAFASGKPQPPQDAYIRDAAHQKAKIITVEANPRKVTGC